MNEKARVKWREKGTVEILLCRVVPDEKAPLKSWIRTSAINRRVAGFCRQPALNCLEFLPPHTTSVLIVPDVLKPGFARCPPSTPTEAELQAPAFTRFPTQALYPLFCLNSGPPLSPLLSTWYQFSCHLDSKRFLTSLRPFPLNSSSKVTETQPISHNKQHVYVSRAR